MIGRRWRVAALAALAMSLGAGSIAQEDDAQDAPGAEGGSPPALEPGSKFKDRGIEWHVGPTDVKVGGVATIALPGEMLFTGKQGAQRYIRETGNLASGDELGIVVCTREGSGQGGGWWACFEYEESGHIKDDEKDELDADKLLEVRKEGAEAANEERKRRGLEPLSVVGWAVPPHYDEQTHNLEYGLLIESESGQRSVNYSVALLGRVGKMDAELICGPEDLESALPQFREVVAGYGYVDGQRYDQFKQGDPVSEIGLTALVAGGAGAVLWKTGLLGKLAKFAKLIVVALLAVVVGIWRKLTGKGKSASQLPQP